MKIAFIDTSYHINKTKSSQFFIDILKPLGDVYLIPGEDAWRIVPKLKADILILWQVILSPERIDSFQIKNVILIPMYDACPHTLDYWEPYKKYKFFCFSKTFYDFLSSHNFNCFFSQYYIKPSVAQNTKSIKNLQNAFFWQRYEKLTWETVKKITEKLPIKHLHFHTGLATNNNLIPDSKDIKKYSITFSSWFKDKSNMNKILNNNGIYIAPRISEGIGLSFIEAIARGNFICAYNAPTMNEYITNGVDGILFTETEIPSKKISKTKIIAMQKKSFERAQKGYKAWKNSINSIRNFISEPIDGYNPKISFREFIVRLFYYIRHIIKKNK